ncbi:hypothetical protein KEM54_001328 [Ascosphaera aggregata]|nr:hypothetical protein KEM54_001328 [Ascosphaera aggregata]
MSRSAADATRFTATGPYASAKIQGSTVSASSTSGTSPSGESSRPNETPKQKVERLRAQARAARMAKNFNPIDRVIGGGRVWADRLHRVTVFTLIAASGIVSTLKTSDVDRTALFRRLIGVAGLLTIYSAASLVIFNRRQRELWIARQLRSLKDARRAYLDGTATLDQLELLAKEKEADAHKMMSEELKKQRYTYKVRQWLFGNLEKDEQKEPEVKPYADADNGRPSLLEALRAKRIEALDGPFDFIDAVQEIEIKTTQEQKNGWFSWLTRR